MRMANSARLGMAYRVPLTARIGPCSDRRRRIQSASPKLIAEPMTIARTVITT
jgi:hypothetical protein